MPAPQSRVYNRSRIMGGYRWPYVPRGEVTVMWVQRPQREARPTLYYRACTPQGAPNPPASGPVRAVIENPQIGELPLFGGIYAYGMPKHGHRQDTNGIETYVVWERCKVPFVELPN